MLRWKHIVFLTWCTGFYFNVQSVKMFMHKLISNIPNICGYYKQEERLHVISRAEEESSQSGDNGSDFWCWLTTLHTLLANLYTNNFWCLSLQLWLWYHLGIDSIMTHVFGFECYSEEEFISNEWSWQTIDMANVFEPTYGFKNAQ